MHYGTIPGLPSPISTTIMGCELTDAGPAVWERFVAAGGNIFDTSHVWEGGIGEAALGDWLTRTNLQDQVFVVVKGAHPPHCDPQSAIRQLEESLERLQRPRADIYFLHRDNLEIPVGEFVDSLNECVTRGTARLLGASNWTIERFNEANAYARREGKQPFALLSNQFSLAIMEVPLGPGVVSATDPESIRYFTRTQTPNFAWSSQARGYFYANSSHDELPEGTRPEQLFDSPRNRRRRERARDLAKQLGVSTGQVALAYVLHQPFPSFAIVGPRYPREVDGCVDGAHVTLTPEQLEWLTSDESPPGPPR